MHLQTQVTGISPGLRWVFMTSKQGLRQPSVRMATSLRPLSLELSRARSKCTTHLLTLETASMLPTPTSLSTLLLASCSNPLRLRQLTWQLRINLTKMAFMPSKDQIGGLLTKPFLTPISHLMIQMLGNIQQEFL